MAQGADYLRSAGKAAAGRLEQGRPCARPGGEALTATIPAKHQASLPQHRCVSSDLRHCGGTR